MTEVIDLQEEEKLPDWQVYSYSYNIVQTHIASENLIRLKSFCTLSMDRQKAITILGTDAEMAKVFKDYAYIKSEGNSRIYRLSLSLPPGFYPREAVVKSTWDNERTCLIYQDHSDAVALDQGSVRVGVRYMGFLIHEVSSSLTKLWFLCYIDPRGTIHSSAVEYLKKKLALVPRNIKNLVKNKPLV